MSIWARLFQRKLVNLDYLDHSEWLRSLSLVDLFSLSMSPTVAPCLFTLLPMGLQYAGPAAIVGVLLAGMASLITGYHYLELARLYPKSGSAYEYSYVVYGELMAFCTGWLMCFDYFLASAFISKELSEHLDFLFHNRISAAFGYNSTANDQVILGVFHSTPDVVALVGVVVAVLLCCLGPKVVAIVCTILCTLSLMVISSSVLVGFFYADSTNWKLSGFATHGATGVSYTASLAVFGFLGVEYITTLVEEARRPLRYWRYVHQTSVGITAAMTLLTTLVLSMILPSYSLPTHAALPSIYGRVNVSASRYVLSIATISGLSASLVSIMLPPARVIHSMAKDKLIWPVFGQVTVSLGTPWLAYFFGLIPTGLAVLLKTETLTNILRLTVPARFLTVVVAGLLMRYRLETSDVSEIRQSHNNYQTFREVRKVRSYSFTSADGSVVSQEVPQSLEPGEHEANSITSSFILQSITTATHTRNSESDRIAAQSKTSDRTTIVGCDKHLNDPNGVVRSVSGLFPPSRHNCLFSPCDDGEQGHIYQSTGPSLTYARAFDAAGDLTKESPNLLNSRGAKESYTKAKFHLLVVITSALIGSQFGLTAEPMLQRQTIWTVVVLTAICCIAILATVMLIRLPSSTHLGKNPVPNFPYLTLLAIFILAFAMASVPISSYLTVLAILFPGLIFYFTYGVNHSLQRNNRVMDESAGEWLTPSVSKVTLTNFSLSDTTNSVETK